MAVAVELPMTRLAPGQWYVWRCDMPAGWGRHESCDKVLGEVRLESGEVVLRKHCRFCGEKNERRFTV